MYITPTIQLWIKFTSTFVDCSDWLLDCGDVETIFNNYDTSLRLVETTAMLSSTIFTDKTIDNDDLPGKDIQIKYDGKVVFVGFISSSNYSSADYTIELDITSVLARLNKKMLKGTYSAGIISFLSDGLPLGQKFTSTAQISWWDFITYLGWPEYETRKANGTLGDNYPPLQTITDMFIVNPYKVVQYIFGLLTGYSLTITDTISPYSSPLGLYEEGLPYNWMWNMNQDYVCYNQDGMDYDKIPLWWDFVNVFMRTMWTIMWNSEGARFEAKRIRHYSYEDVRLYPLPDSYTTFESKDEVMSMRRNVVSKYVANPYFTAYDTTYTEVIDTATGQPLPKPQKLAEFIEHDRSGTFSDAEESIEYPDAKHIILWSQNSFNFPFPEAGLARFRKSYTNTKVLTYPLYDSSDWDGSAFYNLLQNKFVNKDGVYFSELEFFEKVV